jgi:hypothetical protein
MPKKLKPAEFKPPQRRLQLQFMLQTMLLLVLLAGLFFGWFLAPKMKERTLGGGALVVRGQWPVPTPDPQSSLWANSTSPDAMPPVYAGHWLLYDRYRRKLADGGYRHHLASGRWRYFDSKGHTRLEGDARHGTVDGPWTALHEDGSVRQQATYEQQEYRRPIYDPNPFATPVMESHWIAERSGRTRQYWPGDRIRSRGNFRGAHRVGKWTFLDEQGQKTAEGHYRDGHKHGVWHDWSSGKGEPENQFFLQGKRIDDPDTLLARLSADLLSPDTRRQAQAARGLDLFGNRAVPAFRDALRQGNDAQQLLAIRGLKHLGPAAEAAVDDLQAAGQDEHPRVRLLSMVALAEVDTKRAKAIYRQLLLAAANDNAEERELVIASLAEAGPTGLQQLIDCQLPEQDDACMAAFETLARMYETYLCGWPERGDPRVDVGVLDALFNLLESHPDERISERAGELIQRSRKSRGYRSVPFRIHGGII